MSFITVSRSGSAGIAPLSVVVIAPHALANFKADRNRPSSYKICHIYNQDNCFGY
jgi:hypothetical protein